jgi:plasmid maintenance system killer protein
MNYTADMNFRFTDKDLLRLYTENTGSAWKSLPPVVIERFFEAVDDIHAAPDERELRRIPGYHFEKVPRECEGCYSLRLGSQFRLIFKIVQIDGEAGIEIVAVRDYH